MNDEQFKVFYIPKRNGYRKIVTYKDNSQLRSKHSEITKNINKRITYSLFTKAYVKKQSIVKNARIHINNDIFICLDLKDFFQSINHNVLLNNFYYEVNKNCKDCITKFECKSFLETCYISKKGIPIGLIPSPMLANIYLKSFDNIVYGQLKKMNLMNIRYTRYADDLCISYQENGDIDYAEINKKIMEIVKKQLKRVHLQLNDKKTRIIDLRKSNHVRITGINIIANEGDKRFLSVGRKLKNKLYFDAIKLYDSNNKDEMWSRQVQKLKGMQSFIMSVEGNDYERIFSDNMRIEIKRRNFQSLCELINALNRPYVQW